MKIAVLIIMALALIIGGAYTRSRKNRDIHLIADQAVGMTASEGTRFIKKTGCKYIVTQNNNMNRILPERPHPNRIKLHIQDGIIINTKIG